jgi:hypothetical protein
MGDDFVQLGMRQIYGGEAPFGISRADRSQHALVVGQTGSGKSSLLRRMIVADLLAGDGVVLIDPHGDLCEELLDLIPPSRFNDVVLFDPSDQHHPVGFNPLKGVPADKRHLIVDTIVSSLKTMFDDSWGPRLQWILTNCLTALCECENVSILGIERMLVDDQYRQWIVNQVSDPAVHQFFSEFATWDRRFRTEAISPVLNKLSLITLNPAIRNCLGQVCSAFNARAVIDRRKIFLASLPRGKLGFVASSLLGSFLLGAFGMAGMSRSDVPPGQRTATTFYVDEFSTLAGDGLGYLLAEARKYGVSIVAACQQFASVRPNTLDGILGNMATILAFRVGERDAQVLSRQFNGVYPPGAFTALSNHELLVKTLERGTQHEPFFARTLPSDQTIFGRREKLIRYCRERYATPRRIVEDKLERWMRGRG